MDIYYAIGQQKQDPVPAVEIMSMVERGELDADTMGWHRGCKSWMPLKDLPELKDFFLARFSRELKEAEPDGEFGHVSDVQASDADVEGAIPLERMDEFGKVDVQRRVELASPELRFMARIIDLLIYLLLYIVFLRLSFSEFHLSFFNALIWLPVVLLEAVSLSLWGTTPGKALLGLRVVMMDGGKLRLMRMLTRSFYVIFFGMGLVTTVFSPVLLALSWWWTRKNMLSPWDQRLTTLVEIRRRVSLFRIVAVLALALLLIEGSGQLLVPWTDSITAAMEETFRMMQEGR